MRIGYRLLTYFLCCVAILFASRCSDKGTGPSHGITGTWPAEATGRYEMTREYRFCPLLPFGCDYDTVGIDTMDICGDPTSYFVDSYTAFMSGVDIVLDGEISDSLYHVVITTTNSSGFHGEVQITSESTGLPPARDKWQVTGVYDCISCEEWYKSTDRFTFIRIGDADCPTK